MATIYSWTAVHCICIQFHQETQTHKTGFSEHFTVLFCLNVNLYVDPECFLLFNWLSSFVRKATVTSWQPCLCFFTEKIKNNQQYFSRECFWIQASHIHNHLGNRHNLSRHMTEKVGEPLFSPPQALCAVVIGQYCVAFLKKNFNQNYMNTFGLILSFWEWFMVLFFIQAQVWGNWWAQQMAICSHISSVCCWWMCAGAKVHCWIGIQAVTYKCMCSHRGNIREIWFLVLQQQHCIVHLTWFLWPVEKRWRAQLHIVYFKVLLLHCQYGSMKLASC